MEIVFRGYKLGEKGEKLIQDESAEKNKAFLEGCKTLKLDPIAVANIWKGFPNKTPKETINRTSMLTILILDDIKQCLKEQGISLE